MFLFLLNCHVHELSGAEIMANPHVLRDKSTGKVAVVDPGDGPACLQALSEWGWNLDYRFRFSENFEKC